MALRRNIEHLHRFHNLFRVNGLGYKTVNQLCILRDAHVFFDFLKILIRNRPDHRRRFFLAL